MAEVDVPVVDTGFNGAAADLFHLRRRKWLRRIIVGVAMAIAATMFVTRGLSPSEAEARVADVVRSHADGTERELVRAISAESADSDPEYSGPDGAAFSPVSRSGITGTPIVRRLSHDRVRVALVYAEAPVIDSGWGDMYCLVIDVAAKGASHRRTVWADFSRPNHCAHTHREVAQP